MVRVECDPQIYLAFISTAQMAQPLLTMRRDFRITFKKKKSWERLKVTLSSVHKSSIILLPSMSRSRLFTLTLATSNLYSGLILAFQRHWIWPYHPLRVVFVVSPRAVIECGRRRTVERVQLIFEVKYLFDEALLWF